MSTIELQVKRTKATNIDLDVFHKILNLYPEENLEQRPILASALQENRIDYNDLINECNKILIPWYYFLLTPSLLEKELLRIEELRKVKLTPTFFSKRLGEGEITSKRIIDRLIRCQNFLSENSDELKNRFIGLLKNKTELKAADEIKKYFEFSTSEFKRLNKKNALYYLIRLIENKNINVCQGVFDNNKILPIINSCKEIYRNTSGFVLKDEIIPFIFLPSELNPNEREGRQIYTLIYLLVLIGLDSYDYLIKRDLTAEALSSTKEENFIHDIVGEFLLPIEITNKFIGISITKDIRDELAKSYKLTATAVIVILRKRGVITQEEFLNLQPEIAKILTPQNGRSQPINYSIRKFNGSKTVEGINDALKNKSLSNIQAQYLLFGRINKKGFKEYISSNNL